MNVDKLQSFFVVGRVEFNDSEFYKIILYTSSPDNRFEQWEVSVADGWVNGYCKGDDIGMFWQFLVQNGLNEKINIIRG